MRIFSLVLLSIIALMPIGVRSHEFQNLFHSQDTGSGQSKIAQCDVDSLGDLWIITLDKTGSMLSEVTVTGARKAWTPTQIADDVIKKLAKEGGILDQINYSHDRIAIMETGYGVKESDSFGKGFCAAPPLDSSFIHVIQTPQKFNTNRKNGLKKILGKQLKNAYKYRESFVSQIRVLALHRLIEWICLHGQGQIFRKIHIVTITDDADENDQWKMDYYTIKRDPQKMKQLNALHSKYVYSTFNQKGGGYLDEREQFTDASSKNHIYMYDYVTCQQSAREIICSEDSVIRLTPLNGKTINIQLVQEQIGSEKVCFAYIDTITINNIDYPVCQYMTDKMCLDQIYDINPINNEIVIRGKLQVQYNDSILGSHFKCYPFQQYNKDYTAVIHKTFDAVICFLIMAMLLTLIIVFWLIPNMTLFTVCVSDGRQIRIRRGYRWQWDRLTPLGVLYEGNILFAKHKCFKRRTSLLTEKDECSYLLVIDSPLPMTFTKSVNILSDTSRNNIYRNAKDSFGRYPSIVLQRYKKTIAGNISRLQNSRIRWVRLKLYPILNQCVFHFRPHYYYWGNNMEGFISTPYLRNHQFLLENQKDGNITRDDLWLNTFYQGAYPEADVLICIEYLDNQVLWDVYELCSLKISGFGIGSVKHLIHYRQKNAIVSELLPIKKGLMRAIHREMGVDRIVCLDTIQKCEHNIHFNVLKANYMAYICLVENTEEEKCNVLYSPLTDADRTEKNIVIDSCAVSRLIWTSLIPFASKKVRPMGDISCCESLDIVREGPSCQKLLSLKKDAFKFDNIYVKSERTK